MSSRTSPSTLRTASWVDIGPPHGRLVCGSSCPRADDLARSKIERNGPMPIFRTKFVDNCAGLLHLGGRQGRPVDDGHVPRPDPAVIGLERSPHVRLRLSLIDSRTDSVPRPLDLLVDSPPEATFGDLRRELLQLLRHDGHDDLSPEGVTFEVDGRPLADDAPLGTPPLLRGAVVVAAPRHRSRMPSGSVGLTDLVVVGGPGAGRSFSLGRGDHVIGRSTSCSVRLDDPGRLTGSLPPDGGRRRHRRPRPPPRQPVAPRR